MQDTRSDGNGGFSVRASTAALLLNFQNPAIMNSNLLEMLQSQLSDEALEKLSSRLGGVEKEKAAVATETALSTLVTALAKNASTPDGAAALNRALEQDHDGSILDHLSDFLGGRQPQNVNPRAVNGAGILKHVLGEKKGGMVDMLSKMTGLEGDKTEGLLATLAPIVMGALGRQKREAGLDPDALGSLLRGTVEKKKAENPTLDMITSFFDKDGDGSMLDDVAGMIGKRIFGGLFKR